MKVTMIRLKDFTLILAIIGMILFFKGANAQMSPGFQSHNFQYLTGVLTPVQYTTAVTVNAFNAVNLPKWYSMSVTGTATPFQVRLEGSLDKCNWSTIAITSSGVGVVSNINPAPMLYFRMRASNIQAGSQITATAVGAW